MPQDPFAKYGGKQQADTSNPFAQYGGNVIQDQPQPQGPNLDTLRANINSRAGGAGYTAQDAFRQIPLPDKGFFAGVRQGAADVGSLITDVPRTAFAAPQTPGEHILAALLPGSAALAAKRILIDPMQAEAAKAQQLQAKGQPYIGHAIASGIPVIGPIAAQFGEQIGQGDFSGAAGRAIPNIIAGIAGSSPEVTGGFGKIPLPREAATEKIVGSMNVPPAIKPVVRGQVANQLDSILRAGSPTNQAELVNSIQAAMNADPYRASLIESYKGVEVEAPTNYKGATRFQNQEPQIKRATIGQLDDRLGEINDTLYPAYTKKGGGIAAQAAIGSESAAALTAEANSIRQTLAGELSRRTGIPQDTIYAMRKNYGELSALRQQAQLAVDTSSVPSQAGVPLSKVGILQQALDRIAYKPAANRAISSASSRYSPPGAQPPLINDNPFKAQQAQQAQRLFARQKMSELLRSR